MLEFYHRLARRLHGYRLVFWFLTGGAVAVFLVTLVYPDGGEDQVYTLGSVTLLLWTLCLLTITYSFAAPLPSIEPGTRLFARLMVRIKRSFLWLMAASMTALTGLVVFVSVRMVGVLIRAVQAGPPP